MTLFDAFETLALAGFFGDAFCFAALAASFSRFLRAAASFLAAASSRLRCATSALRRCASASRFTLRTFSSSAFAFVASPLMRTSTNFAVALTSLPSRLRAWRAALMSLTHSAGK